MTGLRTCDWTDTCSTGYPSCPSIWYISLHMWQTFF